MFKIENLQFLITFEKFKENKNKTRKTDFKII